MTEMQDRHGQLAVGGAEAKHEGRSVRRSDAVRSEAVFAGTAFDHPFETASAAGNAVLQLSARGAAQERLEHQQSEQGRPTRREARPSCRGLHHPPELAEAMSPFHPFGRRNGALQVSTVSRSNGYGCSILRERGRQRTRRVNLPGLPFAPAAAPVRAPARGRAAALVVASKRARPAAPESRSAEAPRRPGSGCRAA